MQIQLQIVGEESCVLALQGILADTMDVSTHTKSHKVLQIGKHVMYANKTQLFHSLLSTAKDSARVREVTDSQFRKTNTTTV